MALRQSVIARRSCKRSCWQLWRESLTRATAAVTATGDADAAATFKR